MKEEIPFRYKMNPIKGERGFFSDLREFEDDPRFIVKEVTASWENGDTVVFPILDIKETAKVIKEGVDLIEKYLGEFFPKTDLIIGKNKEGKAVIFIVQQKVEGKALSSLSGNNEKCKRKAEQLDKLFAQSVLMFLETFDFEKKEGRYPDIQDTNILLGKCGEDKDDNIYLVDVHPVLQNHPKLFFIFLDSYISGIKKKYDIELPLFDVALEKLKELVYKLNSE